MFSTTVSPSKCVTEPALDAGMSVASPMTNTSSAARARSVCGSEGTNPSGSPSPGERST